MNMRKLTVLTAGLLVSGLWAAVTIDPVARTITKNGGAYSVNTAGDGTWTATTDVDWITIKPRTTGNAGVSCVYIVAANKTADTRVGHVNINESVHTVTQTGYDATLTPSSVTVDLNMHQDTVQIGLDSGVSWTATANADWLTVYPNSGEGSGSVTYTVRSYDGQVPRNGSITIAGKTFTVTQNGIEIILTPEADSVSCSTDVAEVGVHALATTHWQVIPQTNWITVLDAGNGYGDDSVVLAVEENPSYYPRTGYVNIGSATYRLTQKGNDNVVVSISPESVEANESGAYGDIAVDITPSDAPWYAESKTPWLTVAEGSSGDGPGVVRYVASPNSTYADRDGLIRVKPVMQQPDPDYYAGLLWQTGIITNYDGSRNIGPTYVSGLIPRILKTSNNVQTEVTRLGYYYGGADKYQLLGTYTALAKDGNDFSFAFDFSVYELNRINRLVSIGGHSIYVNDDNRLYIDETESSWILERTNTEHTLLIKQSSSGVLKVFVGVSGQRLSCVLSMVTVPFLDFSQHLDVTSFLFGYTQLPSPGYLIRGELKNFMFWRRELTEDEAIRFGIAEFLVQEGKIPEICRACTYWRYFPLDGNYAETNSHRSISVDSGPGPGDGVSTIPSRFGIPHKAIGRGGLGLTGWGLIPNDSNLRPSALSFSFWVLPQNLTSIDSPVLTFYQKYSGVSYYSKTNTVSMTDHSFRVTSGTVSHEFGSALTINEWSMISVVISSNYIVLYVNGQEIGNGTIPVLNAISERDRVSIGGWQGGMDDLLFCGGEMTSDDIYKLYQATCAPAATHYVHQGYIVPALTETNMIVNVDGGTTNVGLSIGSRVAWTATENASWLHITSPKSGTGPTILTFDVDANPRVEERVGTMTIADVVLTVRQRGLWAEVEADTTVAEVDGGYGFVTVTTEADALWSATSHADWLTIVDGEESQGVGQVMWVADPYTDSTHSRIGSMTVAAHKIYITQRGYELSVSTNGVEVSSSSANGQIDVSSPPGTEWSVMATEPWITITSGSTGVGSGTVRYTVAENTSGVSRTGSIIVSGEEYVITQTSTVNVNVQIAGFGSVSGAGTYEQHSVVELIATPDEGYVFSHWSGDVNGNTNRLSVIVDRAKDVVATFIPVAAADQIAADRGGVAEGLYTRDQIHALEMGSLLFDVDSSSNKARVGVMLMETSDLANPNWQPVGLSIGDIDVGTDGSVGLNVPATGNTKFFKVVVPDNN